MPPPLAFSHAVLRTNDNKAALSWYCDLLDGKPVFESPVFSFMTYDDEHHRLAFFALPEPKVQDRNQPGLEHLAYSYDGLRALLEQWDRMKNLGHQPQVALHHGLTISLYYRDPDDNEIECFTNCFETSAESTAFMYSELFQKNFIGYEIDPAELYERLKNGESEAVVGEYDEERALQVDVTETIKQIKG